MFPQNPTTENLSADDIAAIRALYAWSGQTKLQGGTESSPAICACGGTLVIVWRGAGNDQNIWFATSIDGSNWTVQQTILGGASADGPGLAWDGNQLWAVWRGIDGDQGLYYATTRDFKSWAINNVVQNIPNIGSSHGPRIAAAGGPPIMVWKGIVGDAAIYFSTFNAGSGQWNPQNAIGGVGTAASPAICPDLTGIARMVWRGIEGDEKLYTSVLDGLFWQPQQTLSWVITGNAATGTIGTGTAGSLAGPSTVTTGGKIIAAWRGIDNDQKLYFTQLALDALNPAPAAPVAEWSSQTVVPNVGSSHGPSIASFGGKLHLVWKGIEGDSGIYTATL
jgi:hypothetical protein